MSSGEGTPLISGDERRRMLRDMLALVSGSQIATVCGVVTSMVLRRAVDPALWGIWATMRVVLDYGHYSSLGTNRSAALEMAVALGQKEDDQAEHIRSLAMTIEIFTGCLVAVSLMVASGVQLARGQMEWAIAFAATSVIAVAGRYYAFSQMTLRSYKDFTSVARCRVWGAASDMVFMAGGAYLFGYPGLLGGAIVTHVCQATLVRWIGGLPFRVVTDRDLWKSLLIKGWPMAGAALALVALRSVDRLAIVNFMDDGTKQLGWYTVPGLLGAWAFDQSCMVANVSYPRLAETLGRTHDPRDVLRVGVRTSDLLAICTIPSACLLLTAGVPILDWFLQNYRPGLTATIPVIAAGSVIGITMPIRYAMVAIGRSVLIIWVTSIAAVLSGVGSVIVIRTDGTLQQVAWVAAAASGVCLIMLLTATLLLARDLSGQVARVAGTTAFLLAGLLYIGGRPETLKGWVAMAIWCLVALTRLWVQMDWRSLLRRSE